MRIRSIHSVLVVALSGLLLLDSSSTSRAADAVAPNSDDTFKSLGLSKVGSVLQIADEAKVHSAVSNVQGLKGKLASESLSMEDAARALDAALGSYEKLDEQMAAIDAQAKAEKDKLKAAAFDAPHNELLRQMNQKAALIETLRKREGQIADYQAPYADAVAAAIVIADAASDYYAGLARDATVKAAIEKHNKTTSDSVKLGPSALFSSDVAFLKQCAASLALDTIPVTIEGGVPNIDVTINGTTQRMVWDSGASVVSLSSETAAAMGLHTTDKDRNVTATIANGQHVSEKIIVVPEIRVGPFIAEDVECSISPPGKVRPDLVGGSFQRRFLCRLDEQSMSMHLMPIDKSVTTATDAIAGTGSQSPGQVAPNGAKLPGAGAPMPAAGQDIIAAKGLTKVGFLLELPQEAEVHAAVSNVRALKAKVVSEALAKASAMRNYDTALAEYDQLQGHLSYLGGQLKAAKKGSAQYNQLVDPYNQTLAQLKLKAALVDECAELRDKLEDSRPAYIDAVVTAVIHANGVSDQYKALAVDAALAAAIEKVNTGSATPSKLGPASLFSMELPYLRKLAADMASEGISAPTKDGIPRVNVTINGKTQEMLWDSGAAGVSLSAEAAADFGLHATAKDPWVKLGIADGRTFECKLVIVPEIRVGPFIARNIECVIWPKAAERPDSLLGISFQRHFLCQMDEKAGVLHLIPNDKSAVAAADARPRVPPATSSVPVPRTNAPSPPAAGGVEVSDSQAAPEAASIAAEIVAGYPEVLKNVRKFQLVKVFDGSEMSRNGGGPRQVDGAYSAQPVAGKHGSPMFWGANETLDPGSYFIVYRLRELARGDNAKACFLDVYRKRSATIASRHPADSEFAAGQWTAIPIPLTLDSPVLVEYRLWPNGNEIALDRIYVFRSVPPKSKMPEPALPVPASSQPAAASPSNPAAAGNAPTIFDDPPSPPATQRNR